MAIICSARQGIAEVAQQIWKASQDLKISIGYNGVESMITIDKELPMKYRVLQQENRLETLNILAKDLDSKLATRVAGHGGTEGSLTGVTQGSCSCYSRHSSRRSARQS